jgi:hypothetical protein
MGSTTGAAWRDERERVFEFIKAHLMHGVSVVAGSALTKPDPVKRAATLLGKRCHFSGMVRNHFP